MQNSEATSDFLSIWMEFEQKRKKREEEPLIFQGEELEELVRNRAAYLNDLITALASNHHVALLIKGVLEEVRSFSNGERSLYPFMAFMYEAVENTKSFTPTLYPVVQQAKRLLVHYGDATLLRCVKNTMELEAAAISTGDRALDYIGLFEQLVLEDDDEGLRALGRKTCRLYFELKDIQETLLHYIERYKQLNRVYYEKKVIDYNRES